MSHEASPDPLRQALRSLPGARAAAGFTERVLERAGGGRRNLLWATLPLRRPLAALLAAAALAISLVAGGLSVLPAIRNDEVATEPERRARLEALEAERLRLAAELEEIRRLAASLHEPAPVLYLGGDEEVDLVVDLDRLVRERSAGGAYPTHYRGRRTH